MAVSSSSSSSSLSSTTAVAATTAPSTSSNTNDDALDLSEWCNHRVLAKQDDIYVAGIIRSVDESNTILVEFDYPEGTRQTYYNVLGTGRFDVISDASPSAGDVIVGSRVCIRIQSPNRPGNVFVEGIVAQIHNDTKQFVVRIANAIGGISSGNDEFRTVKRGQIRLLRPPWWDELNDAPALPDFPSIPPRHQIQELATRYKMNTRIGRDMQDHFDAVSTKSSAESATEYQEQYSEPTFTIPTATETVPTVARSVLTTTAHVNDVTVAIYGGSGAGSNSAMPNSRSANHRLKYMTSVEQGTPLQLHHVLPTLQVS